MRAQAKHSFSVQVDRVGAAARRGVGRPFAFLRKRITFICAVLLGGYALLAPEARAQASREYDLKAVLLYNFTQFVEWPSLPEGDAPIVIGILGRDPFGPILDEIVRNEKYEGRSLKVQRYRNVQSIRDCHLLFISASEEKDLPRILRVLQGRPILTVGDFEGFAQRGGMIRLMPNLQGKVQLRINLDAIRTADLMVSAKLLRVAEIITPPGN